MLCNSFSWKIDTHPSHVTLFNHLCNAFSQEKMSDHHRDHASPVRNTSNCQRSGYGTESRNLNIMFGGLWLGLGLRLELISLGTLSLSQHYFMLKTFGSVSTANFQWPRNLFGIIYQVLGPNMHTSFTSCKKSMS